MLKVGVERLSSMQQQQLHITSPEAVDANIKKWEVRIARIVTPPRHSVEDPSPAFFAPHILCGSAPHAFWCEKLVPLGVTAVLNMGEAGCHDCRDKYAARGIAYLGFAAEDMDNYPLFEHLDKATAFLSDATARGGRALVHCFAGANRSAAMAIAFLMVTTREHLEPLVRRCFDARPFILKNASFRRQLVLLAARHGLLDDAAPTPPPPQQPLAGAPPPVTAPGWTTRSYAGGGVASATPPSPDDYLMGEAHPEYALVEQLGEGAFATVYACKLGGRAERVAAKVVHRAREWMWIGGKSVRVQVALDALQRERAALRRVGARNHVLAMFGYAEDEARSLIFLELLPGGDLQRVAEAHRDGLQEAESARYMGGLLAALAHCHANGVVHRDVKLDNLLLAADGSVRLADFGHAAVCAAPLPAALADGGLPPQRLYDKVGTRCYCAPEIIVAGDDGYDGAPA